MTIVFLITIVIVFGFLLNAIDFFSAWILTKIAIADNKRDLERSEAESKKVFDDFMARANAA